MLWPSVLAFWLLLVSCLWHGHLVEPLTRTTVGSGGEVCEDGFRKCLRRKSSCEDGVCVCRGGTEWRGNFACYEPDTFHAEIVNDPSVFTFARDSYKLPVTCRYLFTHFKTTYTSWSDSTCEVVIHAYNAKHAGKVFVHGFDFSIRIDTPVSEPPVGDLSIRKYGTAFEGTYTFNEFGAYAFTANGPWPEDDPAAYIQMPGAVVRCRHDPYNNNALIEARSCGFRVEFRPFDSSYGKDQIHVPGLSVGVNAEHNPIWLSLDKVMALVPSGLPTVDSIAASVGLSRMHAMMLRLFQSGTVQNQPDAAAQCNAIPDVLPSCTNVANRRNAFRKCTPILTTEIFVNCYDKSSNGNGVLGLFKECLEALCTSLKSQCQQVQSEISTCSHKTIPELDPVTEPSMCQF